MYKIKVALLSLFISLFLVGCQGDNSDPTVTQTVETELPTVTSTLEEQFPIVVLPVRSTDLTVNSQVVSIDVMVFDANNTPYTSGSVYVSYPEDAIEGRDVGKIEPSSVAVNSAGVATFTYTAPADLTINTNPISFTFYHEDNPTQKATFTFNVVPDANQVILTPEVDLPIVVLPVKDGNLTVNSQVVSIDVRVYDTTNNPYTQGSVKVAYPDDVREGRDVGYFESSSVELNSAGVATFTYTGPSDLTTNTDPISFSFYHEENPTQSEIFTFNINPDEDQIVLTSYQLESSLENIVMGLEEKKAVSFSVKDTDGKAVEDANMVSMTVTLLNSSLGTLLDSSGASGISLTFEEQNNVSVNIESKTISGLLPIQVEAEFIDVNGETQTLDRIFNVTILSGPPTAISLSYAGTIQDETNAKFIESWVVTVTDKYNNKVNTKPAVSMGMLAGYAQSSAAPSNVANYLYYDPTLPSGATGTISAAGGSDGGASFKATNAPFGNVDDVNEYLVTFGNGYTYDASGKWTIYKTDDDSLLDLVDDFNGSDVSELGFAVGNNFRQDQCDYGVSWLGNVYATDGLNVIEETGSLLLSVEYDYYLVGKDVMLWVNLLGDSNGETVKIGTAKKVTMRGMGLVADDPYTYTQGYTGVKRFYIHIDQTPEYYRNANFYFDTQVTGDGVSWHVEGTSMKDEYAEEDEDKGITSCDENGMAYVDINITDSPDSGGTISIINVLPLNEF